MFPLGWRKELSPRFPLSYRMDDPPHRFPLRCGLVESPRFPLGCRNPPGSLWVAGIPQVPSGLEESQRFPLGQESPRFPLGQESLRFPLGWRNPPGSLWVGGIPQVPSELCSLVPFAADHPSMERCIQVMRTPSAPRNPHSCSTVCSLHCVQTRPSNTPLSAWQKKPISCIQTAHTIKDSRILKFALFFGEISMPSVHSEASEKCFLLLPSCGSNE